jgi:hypothetical protein
MSVRSSNHLPRLLRATTCASVLTVAACDSAERATAPSPDARAAARKASREVFVPVGPIIPCVDSIFRADFSFDALNAYPGTPTIGSWTGSQSAGIIRVRGNVGWMFSMPVELTQYAGLTGGVNLSGKIRCTSAPSTGVVVVDWRSLVHSATASFGAIVLRDDQSRILAAVEYRANGVVTFNGKSVPGLTWSKDIPNKFRIRLDLTGHKSALYVDGVLRLASVPYFQASATNLWRINMELGGTSAQSFAWDDILAVRYVY